MKKSIILASQSPRRRELLQQIGLKFEIQPSSFEEADQHLSAIDLAIHNATGKAQDVAKYHDKALIIGVDTVVAYQDHQLNKPLSPDDARRILSTISGTTHEVITAIHIIDLASGKTLTSHETTRVTMDKLTPQELDAYLASGEGDDKAGAYAIQGLGSLFVSKIEGDYFNVVGLPINRLKKMLAECGIKLI